MNTLRHRRSARLALLSAACGVLIALGGLASAPAVEAATPPFLRPMAQALARVHGYQVTVLTASSGSGRPLAATSTVTVLRRGTTLRLHLTTTTHRAGQASTLEEVFTGTHLCVRVSGRSAWSCSALPSSTLTRLRSTDPEQMAQAFGLGQRYVPVGRHTRQG
jgi:hypothetical protein